MTSVTPSEPTHAPQRPRPERRRSGGRRTATTALGATLVALGLKRRSLGGTILVLAGGWLLYRTVGQQRSRQLAGETQVSRSITVGRPADELYDLWSDQETLTQLVGEFAEVTTLGEDQLRWTARGPLGWSPSWDIQIVEDRPGESLRWESLEGAEIPNGGAVEFRPAPGDRGTEVTLHMHLDPPGGQLGEVALEYFDSAPKTLVYKALYRFKSLAETGEIPTLAHNPSSRGSGDYV